jgi:hypothetical protein
MSYLTTPELKSFDKAVISFWFKVPQAALDAAAEQADADPEGLEMLSGLVPLVVFGKEGTGRTSAMAHSDSQALTASTAVHTCVEKASDALDGNPVVPGSTYTMTYWSECNDFIRENIYYKNVVTYSAIPGVPINPSFIAIDRYHNLQINFESTQIGDVTLAYDIASVTSQYDTQEMLNECWTFNNLPDCGSYTSTLVSDGGLVGAFEVAFTVVAFRLLTAVADNYVDTGSSPIVHHPAEWILGPVPGDAGTGSLHVTPPVGLAADTWHHVLISVDMTGGSASTGIASGESFEGAANRISKTSTMYVAIDDVNYLTGGYLFPGTNKVVTGSAVSVALMSQGAGYNEDGSRSPQGPIPSYSLTNMSVPAAEVGIPSVGKYTDRIRKVEMAEFMMFTGVVLDTSVEKNRRLFITAPNNKGEQFPTNQAPIIIPINKYAAGDPAAWEPGADTSAFVPGLFDPSGMPSSNQILGTADIDFTKCSFNWMMGRNLGALKGKVVRTGKIKAYSPDPKLGGQ